MTQTTTSVPTMGEVLSGAPKNWGKWGPDDEVGSLNYLTAEEVLRGVRHVKQGKVFPLAMTMGHPKGDPVWPGRRGAERLMVVDEGTWLGDKAPQFPGGLHYADDFITAFLQGSTQYDALGHVWYDGQVWNGYDAKTTIGGLTKASVQPIAERGVVGRGILIDMARHRSKKALDKGETFTHEDLMAAAEAQGTSIEKHDILVIRTGWLEYFFTVSGSEFYDGFNEPGLTHSKELIEWFRDMEIPNLVTDTIANEVTFDPHTGVALTLHCALMRNLGVAFTEICDLGSLAEDCKKDGQYTFLYVAAPLRVAKGTGAPVNPVAIK
jgi:kynurenine formamidase